MNVPSGYTALDLIGFTDKGDYNSTANYVRNDLVHNDGRVWLCRVDDTTNVTPAVGANWKIWIDEAAYLSGLADTTITNPADGQVLRYDSATSKWVNAGVDSTPTQSSTNLVQSGGVYTQLANKANTADLATVATTGAYSDLSGSPQLAAVATSGAYSDLTGQPTIPTVNDATLTIQKNGSNVQTFTANSNTNKTANITVPDVINDLSDVNISSVANEEILAYDSATSKWKNSGALGDVKQALSNEVVTRSTLGAHNLLPLTLDVLKRENTSGTWSGNTYNKSGIDFAVQTDADGYITGISVSGTATGTAILSLGEIELPNGSYKANGTPSGASINGYSTLYRIYNGSTYPDTYCLSAVDLTITNRKVKVYICRVGSGTVITTPVIYYPMIRLATDSDTTYQPYAKPNTELTKDDNGLTANAFANGAVNLLENKATSQTINGVTFTVNSDGTITANGTATGAANLIVNLNTPIGAGRYHLSGCPKLSSNGIASVNILGDGSWSSNHADTGDGNEFNINTSITAWAVGVLAGKTVSNVVFKPMITLADVPNSDYNHYVPYAKSNKELTPKVGTVTATTNSNGLIALPSLVKVIWANVGNVTSYPHIGLIIGSYTGVQTTFKVVDNTTGNAIANTSVTITYYYLDF